MTECLNFLQNNLNELKNLIITIIGTSSLSVVLLRFPLISLMISKIFGMRDKNILIFQFQKLISCSKCLSFWIVLCITFNPIYASFSYILSDIIEKKLNKHEL